MGGCVRACVRARVRVRHTVSISTRTDLSVESYAEEIRKKKV